MGILNKIRVLYCEIKLLYIQLCELENSSKKEESLYISLVDLLKNKINEENNLIKELINYYNNDIYKVYRLVDTSDIRKRLLDSINMYECINGDNTLDKDEMLEQMRLDRLHISCYRGMNLIYYSFLQEYIDLGMCSDIKESLLKIKYDNSFNNHDMESELVNNNFNIPRVNYIILNLVVDTLRIENNEILLDCFAERILTSLVDILNIKDIDYSDNKKKVLSINNQCILRAGLVMLKDNDYMELVDEMNDIINRYSSSDNSISISIVNSILGNRIKDRERVRRLSLRPLCD